MDFISPNEWGARVNYDEWNDAQVIKDDIAIHWGGNAQPTWKDGPEAEMKILRAWERYHIDSRGWRGLAYGYGIGASGNVYRIRGSQNYGAHLGDYDNDGVSNNKEIVPFVFIMGEDSGPPTDEMWVSTTLLWRWLNEQPWTDGKMLVLPHKDIQPSKPTACPGPDIIQGILDGKAYESAPPPPPPDPEWLARVEQLELAVSLLQDFEREVRGL